MKSTLQSLFDGEILPSERIVPKDPEYRAINRKIGEEKRYFLQKLPPDDARRFEELENLNAQSTSLYAGACFACGFRLCARLMGEAFAEE